MSNVTSLELSKELYRISGWKTDTMGLHQDAPLYELGYLLRKLPKTTYIYGVHELGGDTWVADAKAASKYRVSSYYADTPEDAAAKLCIELFKQNILTREKE